MESILLAGYVAEERDSFFETVFCGSPPSDLRRSGPSPAMEHSKLIPRVRSWAQARRQEGVILTACRRPTARMLNCGFVAVAANEGEFSALEYVGA